MNPINKTDIADIFSIDAFFLDGYENKPIKEPFEEVELVAYQAGREKAGLPKFPSYETFQNNGAASRVVSEHPANFRADA